MEVLVRMDLVCSSPDLVNTETAPPFIEDRAGVILGGGDAAVGRCKVDGGDPHRLG